MAEPLSKQERTTIAKAAVAAADAILDEPILSVDELSAMSTQEIEDYLRRKGVDIDMERVELEVRQTLGTAVLHLDRGAKLDDAELADLEAKVQRATMRAARTIANQTIGDLRQAALDEGDDRVDDERFSMWVAVLDEKCCTSCEDRHGLVFAADMWEGNAPRDGRTLCQGNCRCLLVPVADQGAGEEGKYIARPNGE